MLQVEELDQQLTQTMEITLVMVVQVVELLEDLEYLLAILVITMEQVVLKKQLVLIRLALLTEELIEIIR